MLGYNPLEKVTVRVIIAVEIVMSCLVVSAANSKAFLDLSLNSEFVGLLLIFQLPKNQL